MSERTLHPEVLRLLGGHCGGIDTEKFRMYRAGIIAALDNPVHIANTVIRQLMELQLAFDQAKSQEIGVGTHKMPEGYIPVCLGSPSNWTWGKIVSKTSDGTYVEIFEQIYFVGPYVDPNAKQSKKKK